MSKRSIFSTAVSGVACTAGAYKGSLDLQARSTRGSVESEIPRSSSQVDTAVGAWKKHHGNSTAVENGFKMETGEGDDSVELNLFIWTQWAELMLNVASLLFVRGLKPNWMLLLRFHSSGLLTLFVGLHVSKRSLHNQSLRGYVSCIILKL